MPFKSLLANRKLLTLIMKKQCIVEYISSDLKYREQSLSLYKRKQTESPKFFKVL